MDLSFVIYHENYNNCDHFTETTELKLASHLLLCLVHSLFYAKIGTCTVPIFDEENPLPNQRKSISSGAHHENNLEEMKYFYRN